MLRLKRAMTNYFGDDDDSWRSTVAAARANDKQTTKAAQCAVESDPFLIQIYTIGFQPNNYSHSVIVDAFSSYNLSHSICKLNG